MSDPQKINSAIEIVNLALMRLGIDPILSFTDESDAALLARASYAQIRNDMLEKHPWKFASAFTSLPVRAGAPEGSWGYSFAYDLPGEVLRVTAVEHESNQEGDEWRVVGRVLLTNLGDDATINIEYIFENTDVSTYSPSFIEALSARLEVEWAERLVKSNALGERKQQQYEDKFRMGRSTDGQESNPRRIEKTSWLDVR